MRGHYNKQRCHLFNVLMVPLRLDELNQPIHVTQLGPEHSYLRITQFLRSLNSKILGDRQARTLDFEHGKSLLEVLVVTDSATTARLFIAIFTNY